MTGQSTRPRTLIPTSDRLGGTAVTDGLRRNDETVDIEQAFD